MSISHKNTEELQSPPPPFVVVAATRAHQVWRYLWPFESLKQFVGILVLSVLLTLLCDALTRVWPELASLGTASPGLLLYFLLCLLFTGPYRELPAKMTITTRCPARQFFPYLEQVILKVGYIVDSANNKSDHVRFKLNRGAWLSWLYPAEQVIEASRVCENTIEVRGPLHSLETMQMFLRWKLEE